MPPSWRAGSWLLYFLIQVNYLTVFAFNLALGNPVTRNNDSITISCLAGEMRFRHIRPDSYTLSLRVPFLFLQTGRFQHQFLGNSNSTWATRATSPASTTSSPDLPTIPTCQHACYQAPSPSLPANVPAGQLCVRESLGQVADRASSSSWSGIPRPTTRCGGDDVRMLPNPQEVTLPETVRTWKILETLKDGARWVMTVGPHFQSHHLPLLDRIEANTSDCMCLLFQIRPCETRAQAMHLVNSFMYHDKSIAQVYEGAGWAFPVETLEDTFMTQVHFQGFEILRQTHFPPNFPHHVDLEKSLTPNWLPPVEVLNNPRCWTTHKFAPWTSDWNEAFDARQHHLFKYSKYTAHKAQCRLQCLIKVAKTQNELDAIYEAVRGGAGQRRR